jgi:hypothetical protein
MVNAVVSPDSSDKALCPKLPGVRHLPITLNKPVVLRVGGSFQEMVLSLRIFGRFVNHFFRIAEEPSKSFTEILMTHSTPPRFLFLWIERYQHRGTSFGQGANKNLEESTMTPS